MYSLFIILSLVLSHVRSMYIISSLLFSNTISPSFCIPSPPRRRRTTLQFSIRPPIPRDQPHLLSQLTTTSANSQPKIYTCISRYPTSQRDRQFSHRLVLFATVCPQLLGTSWSVSTIVFSVILRVSFSALDVLAFCVVVIFIIIIIVVVCFCFTRHPLSHPTQFCFYTRNIYFYLYNYVYIPILPFFPARPRVPTDPLFSDPEQFFIFI